MARKIGTECLQQNEANCSLVSFKAAISILPCVLSWHCTQFPLTSQLLCPLHSHTDRARKTKDEQAAARTVCAQRTLAVLGRWIAVVPAVNHEELKASRKTTRATSSIVHSLILRKARLVQKARGKV